MSDYADAVIKQVTAELDIEKLDAIAEQAVRAAIALVESDMY